MSGLFLVSALMLDSEKSCDWKMTRNKEEQTREEWLQYWYDRALNLPDKGGWEWVKEKEIKIFREKEVPEKKISIAMAILKDLITELSLNLYIKDFSKDERIDNFFENLPLAYLSEEKDVDRKVYYADTPDLMKRAIDDSPSANIILLNKQIGWIDKTLKDSDKCTGFVNFYLGLTLIPPIQKSNYTVLENVMKHEFSHMLGLSFHHNRKKGCLMTIGINSGSLCDKCYEAIQAFWHGLEAKTGIKYFKN